MIYNYIEVRKGTSNNLAFTLQHHPMPQLTLTLPPIPKIKKNNAPRVNEVQENKITFLVDE